MIHAFSTSALKGQEPIMLKHVDILMADMQAQASSIVADNRKVDVSAWVQKALFDLMGDLALGSDFGLLEAYTEKTSGDGNKPQPQKSKSKPIDEVLGSIRGANALHGIMGHAGWRILMRTTATIVLFFINAKQFSDMLEKPLKARMAAAKSATKGAEAVELDRTEIRKDMAYYVLTRSGGMVSKEDKKSDAKMTEEEVEVNLLILLAAGAETTAVLVSTAIW
jgi:cytochrome P450